MRFYFRLARELKMSVRRLLREVDSEEIAYWIAFYGLEPWGTYQDDMRNAQLQNTVARCHGAKTRASDFMPNYEPVRQTSGMVKAYFMGLAKKQKKRKDG